MYDPLVSAHPPTTDAHAASYWAATAGPPPATDGPLHGDHVCEVAIVGGGYTGLSAALHLGRDHGIAATVVEAGPAAWGCSGRNGSFARASGGRLGLAAAAKRYGLDTARALFAEMRRGLETVRGLIDDHAIACDRQADGVLKVAHRPRKVAEVRAEAAFLRGQLGYDARFLSAGDVMDRGHGDTEAHAAIAYPDGFAMHPLKLAHGYLAAARAHGARIHPGSPVTAWERTADNRHRLRLPHGSLTAKRLIVATNGYGGETVFPFLRARLMPALSGILVTAPLTADQEAACGFTTTDCIMDTRTLLHYYRRLPDGRVLFGGRGAISGKGAANPVHVRRLHAALARKFPALADVAIDHAWCGWVAITADHLPHVTHLDIEAPTYVAAGYSGSGVSFATLAGKRLAQLIAGRLTRHPLAPVATPPPRFPLSPLRRAGQRMLYAGWRHLDERA